MKYQKTIYRLPKMDCPSEEQMVRMKLADVIEALSLKFDLEARTVAIISEQPNLESSRESNIIKDKLTELGFGLEMVSEAEVSAPDTVDKNAADEKRHRKLLWTVLGINFAFFLAEMTAGLIANSLGMVADSLDMLADSIVYALALIAVGAALKRKKTITRIAAVLQIFLALFGFVETIQKFVFDEDLPDFKMMIFVSIFA
ncbi:hypothetical protein FACS1894125_5650 [Actinomycetota bacterium]|nr:hypothetical protein FACS1894125_5650 [Actinomycetota bacterium]